ncbi:MAG: MFS transporter [Pseudomonadota bacterium]|nr:MFS transporter [Pseudomonadota bacterium]
MAFDRTDIAEAGRSALAKASWRLLPLIGLGYGISYIDRLNISFASLQMNHDLRFSAAVYGLGAGLFFMSYALFEVPSNLLLVRFGARRWLARIMFTWGLLAAGMLFVRTPLQFYVMRFLLGLAEAGFFPGVIFYLSQWFPAAQRGRAISRFYVAWPLSAVFMGAIAGTLLGLQGRLGLAGWQWLFLAEGLPAVALSGVILFALPDRARDAAWLSEQEKAWIATELAEDGAKHPVGEVRGLRRALLDPIVLQFGAVNFLLLGAFYAFNFSAPSILKSITNLDVTRVGYLTSGAFLAGAAAMLLNAWSSDRQNERFIHLIAPLVLMASAYAVMNLTRSPPLFVGAYVLATAGYGAVAAVFWLAPGEAIHTAAAAAGFAAINAIGQFGSFISTWLWGVASERTGDFRFGLAVLLSSFCWPRRGCGRFASRRRGN